MSEEGLSKNGPEFQLNLKPVDAALDSAGKTLKIGNQVSLGGKPYVIDGILGADSEVVKDQYAALIASTTYENEKIALASELQRKVAVYQGLTICILDDGTEVYANALKFVSDAPQDKDVVRRLRSERNRVRANLGLGRGGKSPRVTPWPRIVKTGMLAGFAAASIAVGVSEHDRLSQPDVESTPIALPTPSNSGPTTLSQDPPPKSPKKPGGKKGSGKGGSLKPASSGSANPNSSPVDPSK